MPKFLRRDGPRDEVFRVYGVQGGGAAGAGLGEEG